jgi:hypothetical protein
MIRSMIRAAMIRAAMIRAAMIRAAMIRAAMIRAAMIRRTVVACALLFACDVSDPQRFRPDGGPPACPEKLAGDRAPLVDNDCARTRCFATAIESGCAFQITLAGCEDSVLAGVVAEDGAIELGPDQRGGTCVPIESAEGAFFSAECTRPGQTCRFDVYPHEVADFATPRALSLLTVELQVPAGNDRESLGSPFAALSGYIADAARLKGSIAVATYGGRFDSIECTSEEPTQTFFVSLPDFTTSPNDVSTPPCLTRVAFDPIQEGFLGVFGSGEKTLGRFTRDGVLGLTKTITATGAAVFASDLLVDPDGELVYVLWTSSELHDGAGAVTVHDLSTFDRRAISPLFAAQMIALDFTSDGKIAVVSRGDRRVEFFAARTLQYEGGHGLDQGRNLSDRAGILSLHKPSGLLVVPTTGDEAGVLVLDPTRTENLIPLTAIDYEAGGSVGSFDLYRKNVEWMLAGITDAPPLHRARVARFDPNVGRFLPGSVELGRGVISKLFAIENTFDMVAVMPWSAELVLLSVE